MTDVDPAVTAESEPRPSILRRVLSAVMLAALAGTLWLTWDREALSDWKADAGPLPFFAALAVLPAVGFPTTPFYVLAGALFGIGPALLGALCAMCVNLSLCYWISHSGLRPWLERQLRRTPFELPDFSNSSTSAVHFTLLVRAAPGLPTFIKNYTLGLAGVRFGTYFLVSALYGSLYSASFIVLGESILERELDAAGGATLGLVALGAAFVWWRVRIARQRRAAAADEPDEPDEPDELDM